MKKLLVLALALILAASSAGCGAAPTSQQNAVSTEAAPAAPAPAAAPGSAYGSGFATDEKPYEEEYDQEIPLTGGGGEADTPADKFLSTRKVIRNASLELQTLQFDRAVASIDALTTSFGGYMESSYVSGRDINHGDGTRNASFTVRVPSEKLDAFLNSFGGGEFNIIGKSSSADDVTESYFDSKARLDSLKLQEQRLLAMLDGATELEYMIQLEQELMRVRYEIESLTSQLNRIDGYVSFSTVQIALYEVVKYEEIAELPVTFGQRISQAFASSWKAFGEFCQGFAVGFVGILPFLLLLTAIAAVVLLIVKAVAKRRKPRGGTASVQLPYTPPPLEATDSAEEDKK